MQDARSQKHQNTVILLPPWEPEISTSSFVVKYLNDKSINRSSVYVGDMTSHFIRPGITHSFLHTLSSVICLVL
jgi:hypothetical protein